MNWEKIFLLKQVLNLEGYTEEITNGINALWPRTTIATAAVMNLLGGESVANSSRKPAIIADAAYYILQRDAKTTSGNFFMDDEVLLSEGITNLDQYAVKPGTELTPDFFV